MGGGIFLASLRSDAFEMFGAAGFSVEAGLGAGFLEVTVMQMANTRTAMSRRERPSGQSMGDRLKTGTEAQTEVETRMQGVQHKGCQSSCLKATSSKASLLIYGQIEPYCQPREDGEAAI